MSRLVASIAVTTLPCFAGPVSRPALRTTLPASWDENWFGSPAVYDLDGDGGQEIIAGRHSVLYVWNHDGTRRWRAPVGEEASSPDDHGSARQYAAPVVGDLDGDGDGEIAIAYGNHAALYHHDGTLAAGWPVSFPGADNEIRSIAAADLDADGRLEILLVKTSSGPVTAAFDLDGTVVTGWPQVNRSTYDDCYDFGGYNQNIGAADLTGDGRPEVVATFDNCHLGIFDGTGRPLAAHQSFAGAGSWSCSVPLFHRLELARRGWGADGNDRDELTDSPPCFGDIDGDGHPEVILYSDHERAGEYVNRGNCLWVLNEDMTRPAPFETPICSGMPLYTGYEDNIVQVAPAAALADLSGDGRPEIVVPSYDGRMRCFGADGTVRWEYVFDQPGEPFVGASGAVIGDLDADHTPEIVFCTYSIREGVSKLVLMSGTGAVLHEVPLAKRGSMSPPTLADIDGDEVVEIVVSLKDVLGGGEGGVQVWDVASARRTLLPWPTGRGNTLRTGAWQAAESAIRFYGRKRSHSPDFSAPVTVDVHGRLLRFAAPRGWGIYLRYRQGGAEKVLRQGCLR
jgi:hypothetical protein